MRKANKIFWIIAGIFIALLAYILFIGFTLNAKAINYQVAKSLSESLGRNVKLTGPSSFHINATPSVVLHGLHIANPSEFYSQKEPDVFFIQEAKLSLNLWGLLYGKFIINNVSGKEVALVLKKNINGQNNWTFEKSTDETVESDSLALILSFLEYADFKKIHIDELNVSFHEEGQKTVLFHLDQLDASLSANKNIDIKLNGSVEKKFPYLIKFNGGTLHALIDFIQLKKTLPNKSFADNTPWPLNAELDFLASHLKLSGELNDNGSTLDVNLSTPDLKKFGRLFDFNLPDIGLAELKSHVLIAEHIIRLQQLSGTLGASALSGQLTLDYQTFPTIKGDITLANLDLGPLIQLEKKESQPAQAENMLQIYRQLLANEFDLKVLKLCDADINLIINNIQGLPGQVLDTHAQIILKAGQLNMPMKMNLAKVNLHGQFEAHSFKSGLSSLRFKLWTGDEEVGALAEFLAGIKGIKGQLGKFSLEAKAQGKTIHQALEQLSIEMVLNNSHLSYGNGQGAKAVNFDIDHLNFSIPPLKPLNLNFKGKLLGQPLNIVMTGDAISEITSKEKAQLNFKAISNTAHITALASYSINPTHPNFKIDFNVNAPNTRDVAKWLGFQTTHSSDLSVDGSFYADENLWNLSKLKVKLAQSNLDVNARCSDLKNHPLLTMAIHSDNIDTKSIEQLFDDGSKQSKSLSNQHSGKFNLNIPIFPKALDLSDADIQTNIAQVNGAIVAVKNVQFALRIRDGFMNTSPFSAVIDRSLYEGALLLDMRSAEPNLKIWLNANQINVGRLLKQVNLASNIDVQFGNINIYLESKSSLLSELITNAKLIAVLSQGEVQLKDPNTQSGLLINISEGALAAMPSESIKLKLLGEINRSPIEVNIDTSSAKDFLDISKTIPINLNAQVAKSTLNLSGNVSRVHDDPSLQLKLEVKGQDLSHLNTLLSADLPPWGPWQVHGKFNMTKARYVIDDLSLAIADSKLEGRGQLQTSSTPPSGSLSLRAKTVQLNDFDTTQWKSNSEATNKKEILTQDKKALSQKVEALLSPGVMNKAKVHLEVLVDQVRSGSDQLGKGQFNFDLDKGIASIGPAYIETDGGKALWSLKYHPTNKKIAMNLHVDIHHFDYGVIARRIKPDADIKGLLNLKMDVNSNAPHLSELMNYGNGNLDIVISPENQKSGVLDLWAVNILTGLLPVVDPDKASKINCAIGKFSLKNGVLSEKQLQIDTSRMRVNGMLMADFKSEKIYAKLRPQAKEVQFLSLSTPVQVTGTFSDYKIGLSAGDVVETVVRLGTSIFWVPIKKLFAEKMIADGSDICLSAD